MITARVGNVDLRIGTGIIAPPAPGGLVQLGTGTGLQGSIPGLVGGGPGVGLKSVGYLTRLRINELLAAFAPGGNGEMAIVQVGSAFELAIGGSSSAGFLLGSTFPQGGFINGGPETGLTPHPVSVLPALNGFYWIYACIDYTTGGSGNATCDYYMLTDSGTVLAGTTTVIGIGSGNPFTDPTQLIITPGVYGNAPFATNPGSQVIDGLAVFGSITGSCRLTGMARNTPPALTAADLLATYGFANVFTPDQPGLVAPLVPYAPNGGTPSAIFLLGGIFN